MKKEEKASSAKAKLMEGDPKKLQAAARLREAKSGRPKTQMVDAVALAGPLVRQPARKKQEPTPPPQQQQQRSGSSSSSGAARQHQQQQQQQRPGNGGGVARRPGNASAAPDGRRYPAAGLSVGKFEKLERGVVGGEVWNLDEDEKLEEVKPEDGSNRIPAVFSSFEDYLGAMEPLLTLEAMEGTRNTFGESCEAGKALPVEVMSVQAMPGSAGWLAAQVRFTRGIPNGKDELRDGSIVALLDRQPPRTRDAAEWVSRQLSRSNGKMRSPADVASAEDEGYRDLDQQQHKRRRNCDQEPPPHDLAVAMAVVKAAGAGGNGDRRGPKAELRLCFHPGPLGKGWVNPADAMSAVPQSWWLVQAGDLITVRREIEALRNLEDCSILEPIMDPSKMAKRRSEQKGDHVWPHEVAQHDYNLFLRSQYDQSQVKAIMEACAHLSHPDFGGVGPEQAPYLPFTLIQGPPGTGKTHTVRGILNTWHLVQYQRYYTSLVACLAPKSTIAAEWRKSHGPPPAHHNISEIYSGRIRPDELDNLLLYLPGVQPRPRVLVCAPSNAATDELLQRIMNDGFRAANGSVYRPNVVRVGSGAAPLSDRARDVWVDAQVKQYLTAVEQQSVINVMEEKRREASHFIQLLRHRGHLAMQNTASQEEVNAMAQELAALYDSWYKARQELVRMELVLNFMQDNRRGHVMDLELELVEHAEIIFTTLSSSGRNIFARLKERKYMTIETVLIDEACQAYEVAVLQPLMYGCRKCVMVGDPQQLPATVLSLKAKERDMERSLFERFQQGSCPVLMLTVQYRMHPEIRQFPSNHFYEGRLQDGDCILERPPAQWYSHNLLKPYIFFDVDEGKEVRTGGKSVSNQAEADMAVGLYVALLHYLEEMEHPTPVSVGVITPYRDQRDCLKRTFQRVCGEKGKEVFIETVDSFQGRQLDVVMLSCVRATANKSRVGFVGDIRRMNVAITRAMLACWVLGDAATLRSSPTWHSLIDDADKRQRIVARSNARSLFPQQFGPEGDGTGQHYMAKLGSAERPRSVPTGPPGPPGQQQQQQQHNAALRDHRSAAMDAWSGGGGAGPPGGGGGGGNGGGRSGWGSGQHGQRAEDPHERAAALRGSGGGGGSSGTTAQERAQEMWSGGGGGHHSHQQHQQGGMGEGHGQPQSGWQQQQQHQQQPHRHHHQQQQQQQQHQQYPHPQRHEQQQQRNRQRNDTRHQGGGGDPFDSHNAAMGTWRNGRR